MRSELALVLVIAGCGRLDFDLLTSGDAGGGSDGPRDGAGDASLSDLVAWLQLDDDLGTTMFLDEIQPVRATCVAGQCPTKAVGHVNGAYQFDGVDDCLVLTDQGQLQVPRFTIALWVHHDATESGSAIAKRVDIAGTPRDSWQLESTATDGMQLTMYAGGLNVLGSPDNALPLGSWHHVAATWDGSSREVYIDGALKGQSTVSGTLTYDTHSMYIGCDDNNPTFVEHWTGAIDDVRVYSRVLSAAEILLLSQQ